MNLENKISDKLEEIKSYKQGDFSTKKYNRQELLEIDDFRQLMDKIDTTSRLEREDVIKTFQADKLYKGFVLAMMWGGINSTRPSIKGDYKTTNFYKSLNVGKEKLEIILYKIREEVINENLRTAYNKMYDGKWSIPGIGESYFTKLFYFLGEAESVSPTPLIYDKWTKLIHVALLIQDDELELLKSFYSDVTIQKKFMSDKVGLANTRSKSKTDSYIDYVQRMHQWAMKIDVTSGQLESYLFGLPLVSKKNRGYNNPRVWIHQYVKEELDSKFSVSD